MTTRAERLVALDRFMAAQKRVVRPDVQGEWLPGALEDERRLRWPLEVDGELLPDSALLVVGYPRERELIFRLMILHPAALCRLDHADEFHMNPTPLGDGVPPSVQGPHYHCWPINRAFFEMYDHPVKLRNAVLFEPHPSFDAALRWFCHDNGIEPLPANHQIELPRLDTLL